MFTQCPHCQTVFRVSAEQLAAAHGQVKCGRCLNVFDALAHLHDQPTETGFREEPTTEQEPSWAPEPESGETLPEEEQENEFFADLQEFTVSDKQEQTEPDYEFTPEETPAPIPETPDLEGGPKDEGGREEAFSHEVERPLEPGEPVDEDADLPPVLLNDEDYDLPEALRADLATPPKKRRSGWATAAWLLGVLFLLLLLAGQGAYFYRDELATRPNLHPWLERLCQTAGCELAMQRDLSQLEIIDRNVSTHPRAKHALMITATFVNRAPFPQPYPDLHVTLSDINGAITAQRHFKPKEYLASGVDTAPGLRTGDTARVILEVADPGRNAVAFQFEFL